MWTWRIAARRAWPQVAQMVVLNAAMWITGNVFFGILSIGFTLGWGAGSLLNYRYGMNDREKIIASVWGDEWKMNATVGKYVREKREGAQSN